MRSSFADVWTSSLLSTSTPSNINLALPLAASRTTIGPADRTVILLATIEQLSLRGWTNTSSGTPRAPA